MHVHVFFTMCKHLLLTIVIQFLHYYLSSYHLQKVKANENFKHQALKVVVVAYKRWSHIQQFVLVRNFNLLFWKTACQGEVVTYKMWSQIEVQMYMLIQLIIQIIFIPFFVPVVLYPVTSVTSFDKRATFILYLLSYDKGRPSLEDVLSLLSLSVRKEKCRNITKTIYCSGKISY